MVAIMGRHGVMHVGWGGIIRFIPMALAEVLLTMCVTATAKRRRRQAKLDRRYIGSRRDPAARARKETLKLSNARERERRMRKKG